MWHKCRHVLLSFVPQVDSNFQQNCKMDSCEHEYLKSGQLHLAQLVCQRPMTERLVSSVVSAGSGLLRPKNPLQTTGSNQRMTKTCSTQDKALLC